MAKRFYTIGMAGHIDHGKTTLTKALTNVDTDRLKEEKERSISIELGFAPLDLGDEDSHVAIIDVPGHEKFIRQMIAGVAGIDLVLLVVAADEGVMQQTAEHLDILRLLGIHKGLIVVTKRDQVEDDMIELIEADIQDQVEGTFFEGADLLFVDSISKKGIPQLLEKIKAYLNDDDEVVAVDLAEDNQYLVVVTELGFGKKTPIEDYRSQIRGGKGVITYNIKEKTGDIVSAKVIEVEDEIMMVSSSGIIIRLKGEDISTMGRSTQGVTLMRMNDNKVVAVAKWIEE